MKKQSLFENAWFIWIMAIVGLVMTSVVFPSVARQEPQVTSPKARKVVTPRHKSAKAVSDRGMIVIR